MNRRKDVYWEGDSFKALKSCSKSIRRSIGYDLRRLQHGKQALHSKPMKTVASGIFELTATDDNGWVRAIYTLQVKDMVYVLHCFHKKTNKTPKKDLDTARRRYRALIERFRRGEES